MPMYLALAGEAAADWEVVEGETELSPHTLALLYWLWPHNLFMAIVNQATLVGNYKTDLMH